MAKRTEPEVEAEEGMELPPPEINPLDVLDRLSRALDGLNSRPSQTDESQLLMTRLAEALERVSAATLDGAKLQAAEARRIHRPSNDVVPQISVLNPRGERDFPKPRLKCLMMIPWLADPDSLSREEIELLNLLEPGEFVVRKMDGTKVKVTVRIDYGLDEITPSRLLMNHETAFNNDNHRWMPPLTDFVRQVLNASKDPETKAKAAAVLTMDEEVALIEAGKLLVAA